MKSLKKRNIILIVVALLLLGIAIGYAALSQTLTINGTANIKSEWDVKITNITEGTLTNATTVGSVTHDDTSATFEVDLEKPGAIATYEVEVSNNGTIDAKLESVTDLTSKNAEEPKDIKFEIDATTGDELAKRASEGNPTKKIYTVTVKWDENSASIPNVKTKTATIELKYVQK